MNVVQPPPLQPGDDLDELLRAFLRSQLPQPWPPPPLPSAVTPGRRRPAIGQELMRSRWALAASVALLFFGSWLLPGRFTPNAQPQPAIHGDMISDNLRDTHDHQRQKQVENKNKTGLAADDGDPLPERDESDMPMFR